MVCILCADFILIHEILRVLPTFPNVTSGDEAFLSLSSLPYQIFADPGTNIAKFIDKLKKIRKERMFMFDRQKGVDKDGHICETFDIAGSKGNIYQATIGRKPKCDCMDAVRVPIVDALTDSLTTGRECEVKSASTLTVRIPPMDVQQTSRFRWP